MWRSCLLAAGLGLGATHVAACDTVDALQVVTLAPGADVARAREGDPQTIFDLLDLGYSTRPVLWGGDFAAAQVANDHTGREAVLVTLTTPAAQRYSVVIGSRFGEPMALVLGDDVLTTFASLYATAGTEVMFTGGGVAQNLPAILASVAAFNGDCPKS